MHVGSVEFIVRAVKGRHGLPVCIHLDIGVSIHRPSNLKKYAGPRALLYGKGADFMLHLLGVVVDQTAAALPVVWR